MTFKTKMLHFKKHSLYRASNARTSILRNLTDTRVIQSAMASIKNLKKRLLTIDHKVAYSC